MITVPYAEGFAIQIARPLTEVDHSLSRIRTYLLIIAAIGIALAAALGLAVARTALAPVRRLTGATENVTKTGDLSERIDASGTDELSRLAASFNTMLAALEESTRAQQQLVGDASHELRTPLTSLRTNVEVLAGGRELPPEERERLLRDVIEQLDEMTTLVAELSELARGELEPGEAEDVRLDLLAADAVERTRRNRPGVEFKTDFEESLVHGVPASIERAVANLLDNAAKWSPPEGEVEVTVKDGEVVVRRPRARDRRGRPPVRLRPLLPRQLRARDARLGARPRDREAGRGVARRRGSRRAGRGRRHAHESPPERPAIFLGTS